MSVCLFVRNVIDYIPARIRMHVCVCVRMLSARVFSVNMRRTLISANMGRLSGTASASARVRACVQGVRYHFPERVRERARTIGRFAGSMQSISGGY